MQQQTPLGVLEVWFPDGEHAGVSAGNRQTVQLGTRQYTLQARLVLTGGVWQLDTGVLTGGVLTPVWTDASKPVPPSFEAKAVQTALDAVRQAVSQNPTILAAARAEHTHRRAERARAKVAGLREELANAERALEAAETELCLALRDYGS